jgi:hypothetical protein
MSKRQDGMKVHPRVFVLQEAQTEFDIMFLELERKHELTVSEMFLMLSDRMRRLAGQCVCSERNGDGDA